MAFWDYEYLDEVWHRGMVDPLPEQRADLELHPSGVGCRSSLDGKFYGACPKKAWFGKMFPEAGQDVDIAGAMIMGEGNHFESHAASIFMNAGVAIRPNPVYGQPRILMDRIAPGGIKYHITCRLDLIYRNPEQKRAILDFKRAVMKSTIDQVMGRGWNGKRVEPSPKDQNLIQMAVYADWGRTVGITDCKLAYAIPSEKQGRVFDVIVKPNGDIFVKPMNGFEAKQPFNMADIYAEFDKLAVAIANNVTPESPFGLFYDARDIEELGKTRDIPKSWQDQIKQYGKAIRPYNESPCSYCEYMKACHGDEAEALVRKIRG